MSQEQYYLEGIVRRMIVVLCHEREAGHVLGGLRKRRAVPDTRCPLALCGIGQVVDLSMPSHARPEDGMEQVLGICQRCGASWILDDVFVDFQLPIEAQEAGTRSFVEDA